MSEEKKAYEADTGEYELDFDAEPTEVEIADDESPSSKTRSVSDSDDDSGSDHEEYASSVQKRIDKLTKKMREAERREQAALEYAQNVQSEVHQLKGRVKSLDEGYLSEYGTRLIQEQQAAENELRHAVDMGDSEAVVNAQRKLTQLAMAGENTAVQCYSDKRKCSRSKCMHSKRKCDPNKLHNSNVAQIQKPKIGPKTMIGLARMRP